MTNDQKSIQDVRDTAAQLQSDLAQGLTAGEAQKRLEKFGPNEIPEQEESILRRILKRLWGPIPGMIEAAAILSALARKWEDLAIILVLLCVNVIVDFVQESKALNVLKALKATLARTALVKRDGKFQSIESRLIVPGDLVKLKIGDIIPADAVLTTGQYVQIDQAALTGESLPVTRHPGERVYGNSIIKMGEMEALVTETGLRTYFGKTASLVVQAEKRQQSHLQKAVIRIGNHLIGLTLILAVLLVTVSLFRHDPFLEVSRFILVLVVASIPVALPAVLSVTMAVGALKLARQKAVVSRLAAIEELAGVDTLCCDKTGTLTQNSMTLAEAKLYNNFSETDILTYATLASRKENNDPIERPIFDAVARQNLGTKIAAFTQDEFTPFDPVRKRADAKVHSSEVAMAVVKGAPQVVLALCKEESNKKQINGDIDALARQGYRTLGVAVQKNTQGTYSFVGLLPLFDPPREDSKAMIGEAKHLGLAVKMVTGDNTAIAHQIAQILDIGPNILDTHELRYGRASEELPMIAEIVGTALYRRLSPDVSAADIDRFRDDIVEDVRKEIANRHLHASQIRLHESEIIDIIESADGFAQVLPEDKFFIIDKLQKADHIVAMTGDGVNDAPALKKADAGIAVSGATDAARAAADIVLLLPGLSVIINAISEARTVFERMKSYAIFRIAETTRVIVFMSLSILIFNFYPVTAVMIIILALLNDIPIMMIAYDNARPQAKPVRWDMREVMTISSVLGIAGVLASFLLYYGLEQFGYSQALIQTLIFLKLDVAGHSTIYTTRTGEKHFWKKPYPSLKFFLPAFGSRSIGTLVAVYGIFMTPIGWRDAGLIWAYATLWFLFNDFVKVRAYKYLHRVPAET